MTSLVEMTSVVATTALVRGSMRTTANEPQRLASHTAASSPAIPPHESPSVIGIVATASRGEDRGVAAMARHPDGAEPERDPAGGVRASLGHSHPGPSIVVVKAGALTLYRGDDPDCTPHVIAAGSGFVDDGGDVHVVRNEGSVDALVYVTSLVPQGADRRINEPSPGTCSF